MVANNRRRKSKKSGSSEGGQAGLRNMLRHLLFAASTVVARGAETGGSLWHSNSILAGAALVTDRLGFHGRTAADTQQKDEEDKQEADQPSSHWQRVADERPRQVRFEPPVIIKVTSWKEETKQMHYRKGEEPGSTGDLLAEVLDDAMLRLKSSLSSRLALTAATCLVASGSLIGGASIW
ncbi:unnamed protein product [Polarella glacialis]|uniref:Uncharacterized protein n=1 Tax=Polarella glacialis TaxID=89957 RepID=A0A813HB90_POLGL|nr:unnamed protein product [Polarella glacialis]|mmetsp:Transcript_54789/g.88471  ORF Transcript_54789/g.88471 Transcript_54789/m.88471 type:complete len:180 (-) Transcript_54789:149-688(-)|eukprot:CAMPEP_0115091584 /NCGR_PEP_ID=MMETSP0227-20121206/26202_1 /TAXON_ID=89957 /ORGANISM="Polarella glacialis, Strain CCMP 1383" /LENGTH=179 /DNA_ID=CAMNT_0002483129 /DNA_START=65 /DNA_END=604 /DNA_ORIENTATION=+